MVEVLAFLFENFLHRPIDIQANLTQIARELPRVGFSLDEVDGAMDWLEETLQNHNFDTAEIKNSHSLRSYHRLELAKIDEEARGMIYGLETKGLITPAIRELLIDRAMALNIHAVGIQEMQWVLLFVMMNSNAQQDIINWITTRLDAAVKID